MIRKAAHSHMLLLDANTCSIAAADFVRTAVLLWAILAIDCTERERERERESWTMHSPYYAHHAATLLPLS